MNTSCSAVPCPVILSTTCVFYEGGNLIYTGIVTNDSLQTALQKIDDKFHDAAIGYAFTNGLVQSVPGDPVKLGGVLIEDTIITSSGFLLTFTGNIQAAKFITSGGTSSQFLKGDGTLDSNSYQLSGNYITSLIGDGTASGPGISAFTLATVTGSAGTWGNATHVPVITINSKGLVTNVSSTLINIPSSILSFVGDVTGTGMTGVATTLTLATVNTDIYGTNTVLKFAVNAKGLVISAAPITALDLSAIFGYIPVPPSRTITINGISHDLSSNASWTIAGGGGGGGAISIGASSMTLGTAVFNNSNGVSFGLNGSVITASVDTNYQPIGSYLTTAALSNHSHGNPTLSLVGGLSGNVASNSGGFTLSLSQASAAPTPIAFSAGSVITNVTALTFANSNGISFGLGTGVNDGVVTATIATNYQPVGAYLTTAMQSNASLSNIADVTFSGLTNGQYLQFNGTNWVNVPPASIGVGGGQILFFDSAPSGVSTYESIDTIPAGDPEADENITINNNTLPFEEYSTPLPLGRTTIEGGVWDFNIFCYALNLTGGGTYLLFDVFKRDGIGTETLLFTTSSFEIVNSTVALQTFSVVQPSFSVSTGDRLVVKVRATTTQLSNVDLHFVHSGTIHYSHINTPLATLHNSLPGLDGGNTNGYFHLNSTDYGFRNTVGTSVYQLTANMSNYQTVGNYLTTAMLSNGGSNFVGLNSALTGNGISATINSSGISLNVPAFLTTAALSQNSSKYAGVNGAITGGSITLNTSGVSINLPAYITTYASQSQQPMYFSVSNSNTSANTIVFGNSNGISWNYSNGSIIGTVATNYQSQGAYLTTARVSNDGIGLNTALTANGVSVTANSSGLSLNFPAFLTTAMQSNAATISNIKASAGTLSNNLSAITFGDSNGISWGLNTNSVITATVATNYQSQGAYLTTAMVSNAGSNFVGLNSAITANGVSMTNNSSGLSLNFPAFLTTAMQSVSSSVFAKTGFSTASTVGSNIVGTHDTNGLSLGIPNFLTTAGAGGAAISANGTAAAGSNSQNTGTVVFANSNGITFGLSNNGSLTASHNGLTTAAQSNQVVNSLNGSVGQISLNAGSSLSSSQNGSSITFGLASNITTALQSAGAYLTTAMASNAATISNINISGGSTSSNLSAFNFVNSNGVSWSLDTASKLYATVATNYQSQGAYLTTARASNDGMGLNTAQTNVTWTANSSGLSINAGGYAGTGITTASTAGSDFVITHNTGGLSMGIPQYLTTAALSNHSHGNPTLSLAGGLSGATASGSNGFTLSLTQAAAAASPIGVSAGSVTNTYGTLTFSNSNNISFGLGTGASAGVITASAAGITENYFNGWNIGGNVAGTTSTGYTTEGQLYLVGGNNITLSGNSNSITFSAGAGGGGVAIANSQTTYVASTANLVVAGGAMTIASTTGQSFNFSVPQTSSFSATGIISLQANGSTISIGAPLTVVNNFEPFSLFGANTATSTGSVSALHLQPLWIPNNISFNQLNMIVSASVAPTSAGNTFSFRLTGVDAVRYSAGYSITNSNVIDLYLLQMGTGGYSSELETIASTRHSVVTYYNATFSASANYTGGGGSTGSVSLWQSLSASIVYPAMTSGTMTSVNAGSTFTTWAPGYSTFAPAMVNTSISNTYNTTNTASTSVASTYPGTTAWSSWKMIPFPWATSLSCDDYYLGIERWSSTSSSSQSGNTIGTAGTGASYTVTYNASNLTVSNMLTYVGATNTIVSSLGWLGAASQASMAPSPGHGSFSATWNNATTYLNNAGNPNGAIAFTQIRSQVSNFKTWIQLALNRI